MIRDPFYRDIERELGGRLDPELFEQCAADVLRTVHPTLVPIRGGNDAGMDGAIAAKGGLPYPLVTTTSPNVVGNLRRSLRSYLQECGTRRTVVLATSQALTSARRHNLEKAAKAVGFVLHQIHDRAAFADLLYRDPHWCQELLGITGAPPPLSVMPLPTRPLIGDVLVGRSDDMHWLVNTEGDLLLIGQPGVGKTFLLHHFAKENGGLFVHTADLGEIAAGLRRQKPSVLIVDDAHVRSALLPELRRLRSEMGAKFRIIADSWPGSRDEITRALDVPSASVRTLELLSKDEIVEVVKGAGIAGPTGLVQEIVNQAEGKPGLAITLAHLCLRGDVQALAQGDALAQELAAVFGRLVGHDVRPLLAAFAVGGNAGMTIQAVASYLGIPLPEVWDRASKLAAGGVLLQLNKEQLSVRPPALRHVLVRDVFFGATAMPIEPLVLIAPNINDLTATLIGAQFRGARISPDLMHSLVEQCSSSDVWANYARLGHREATWIAADHPEWLTRIGNACLDLAPDLGLPPLFRAAVGDSRSLNAYPGHPMRIIGDWVAEARPGTPLVIERREQVLRAAEQWLDERGDPAVGLHGLSFSLAPGFSRTELVPGSGHAITFQQGFVTLADTQVIRRLWPRVRDLAAKIAPEHWHSLQGVIESWAYHGPLGHPLPADLRKAAEEFAAEMLTDLVSVAKDRPGFLHWAEKIADRLEVKLPVTIDPVFEILFPPREFSDWRRSEAEQLEKAMQLANQWAAEEPGQVVDKILWCEQEARLTSHAWPRWTSAICRRIAERVYNPMSWIEELLKGGAASDLVQPFLQRINESDGDRDGQLARRCLEDERQRLGTAITLLTSETTPPELVELALARLQGAADWINTVCLRGQVPESILVRLFNHPDDVIAAQAAVGAWGADPKGEISPSLREAWEHAILRCPGDEWFLREILKANPPLAVKWLTTRLQENKDLWRCKEAIEAALGGISAEQRRDLLAIVHEDLFPSEIVKRLIDDDLDLFRELLQTKRLKSLHLEPLTGHPNLTDWAVKAEMALAAGYPPGEIAESAFGQGWSWSGNVSDMWNEWVKRFADLSAHANERIREIGRIGSDLARQRRDAELKREREERIRGW